MHGSHSGFARDCRSRYPGSIPGPCFFRCILLRENNLDYGMSEKKKQKSVKMARRLDHTPESRLVLEDFRERGMLFSIVHSISKPDDAVPALETQYGAIRGFKNICRYFIIPGARALLPKDRYWLSIG